MPKNFGTTSSPSQKDDKSAVAETMFQVSRSYMAVRRELWGRSSRSGRSVEILAGTSGVSDPSRDFIAGSGDVTCVVEEMITQDYSCILLEETEDSLSATG